MGLSLSPRQRSPAHSRDPKFQPLRSQIPPQIFNRSSSSVSYEASTTSTIFNRSSSSVSYEASTTSTIFNRSSSSVSYEIPNHCPEISSRTSPAASTMTTSSISRSAASRSANHCPEISSRTSPAASTTTMSSISRSAASRSAIPNSDHVTELRDQFVSVIQFVLLMSSFEIQHMGMISTSPKMVKKIQLISLIELRNGKPELGMADLEAADLEIELELRNGKPELGMADLEAADLEIELVVIVDAAGEVRLEISGQ
ncbi:uncharacterized protein A4U43_C07F36700 [Asparagus officinalis]|uniref:Uncharacterized protein n=1 Tax=Asparagus officinalis TaxID=4686 RepID=A0A5P1EKS5_ASPOF|nr:uncharacterized protein A4U43_C07F36700 [Asparagus officinalis]